MKQKHRTRAGLAAMTWLALGAIAGCAQQPADDSEEAITASVQALKKAPKCKNPEAAILRTLDCIQSEDAACAAAGYAPGFVKLHNTVDTHTVIAGPEFWAGAFFLLDFDLDIDHVATVGRNEVSVRYVETVTTLFGDVFQQHEHALVTVDEDCKMTLWDQYGDNAEQKAVDDAVAEILASLPPPPSP